MTETTRSTPLNSDNAEAPDDQRVRTRTRTRHPRNQAPEAQIADAAPNPQAAPIPDTTQPTERNATVVRRRRQRRSPAAATMPAGPAEPAEPAGIADAAAVGVSDADAVEAAPDAVEAAPDEVDAAPDEVDAATDPAEAAATGESDGGHPTRSRRSRRRGGRGRGRRGSGRSREAAAGEESTAPADAPTAAAPVDAAPADTTSADTVPVDDALSQSESAEDSPSSTRPQARSRSARGRSATRSTRGRSTGGPPTARRPLGGVSEETRRAITEGPPRRMMVTVGEKRTQIAVLEERTLVEHYVTRREDVSYVGNIYLGRVQNVLPGMEAAFVDIGKGRNGVLYAGEVNYDEADLEGELPRIEQTLKLGQSVLVQVTKDPMGTKGARLTQHLSIAGRYCVLAPGEEMLGISRKLTDDERERLRKILKGLKPEGYGLIVRTAAEGATREQLEADVARLERIWDQVSARAERAKPLEAVYEEPGLVIRVIRDVFGSEYSQLTVDSEELATQVRTYLDDVSPEFVDKVSVHTGEDNVFDAYEITNQIRRALERKVWLKSGGYLIVEKTEAMWVIDVNTGKFVGERNLEETVLRNNIEAATEIARQLRLRDMGGIIVIDFVDMLVPANRDEVLKRFRRELARDKTKSRVMEISKLGLVQMTRKNVSQGLQESFTTRCDVCEGRGARIVESIV